MTAPPEDTEMKALLVLAHPAADSLTQSLARTVAQEIVDAGHSFEIADLAAGNFDPRYDLADRALHHGQAQASDAVRAEQVRIERADALVLVYPVYWWSMPGLLKGWIDRVFTNGWAYEDRPGGAGLVKRLGRLPVHLLAVAGAEQRAFEKRGYRTAMATQIETGIFDYCGAPIAQSEIIFGSETLDTAEHFTVARAFGRRVFDRV